MENLKLIDEIEDVEEVEEKREVFEINSLSGEKLLKGLQLLNLGTLMLNTEGEIYVTRING